MKTKINGPSCDCGGIPRWRGSRIGRREFFCDQCYCALHTRYFVQSEQVRGERRHYWVVDRQSADRFSHGRVTDLTSDKRMAFYLCANLNEKWVISEEEGLPT